MSRPNRSASHVIDATKRTVTILALDGGGIRSIIPAKILVALEEELGGSVAKYFDIIAGTSASALVALGLAATHPKLHTSLFSAAALLHIWVTRGPEMYKSSVLRQTGLVGSKISDKKLTQVLHETFSTLTLADTGKIQLLITANNTRTGLSHAFRNHAAKQHPKHNFKLAETARAAGGAPGFFKPSTVTSVDGTLTLTLGDGSLSLPNPTLAALQHAKQCFPNATTFLILSLGTGRLREMKRASSLVAAMEKKSDGIDAKVDKIMAERARRGDSNSTYLRLHPILDSKRSSDLNLTDASPPNIKALQSYADDVIRANEMPLRNFAQALKVAKRKKKRPSSRRPSSQSTEKITPSASTGTFATLLKSASSNVMKLPGFFSKAA